MKFRKTKIHSSDLASGHKSHKKLWVSLSVFTVILLLPVLLLGWMGLVPGLSNLMGSANPKDLGVRYSQSDVTTYKQKTSIQFKDYTMAPVNPNNPTEKLLLANPTSVPQLNLSQEEIMAMINFNNWSWMPVENIQVRLTEGIVEISGSLNVDRIEEFREYISGGGNLDPDATNAINWAKRLRNNAPIYIKANASISNNVLSFTLLQAQIGRLSIPLGNIGDDLSSGTTANINSDHFSASSAKLTSGTLQFSGTYPATIYIKK